MKRKKRATFFVYNYQKMRFLTGFCVFYGAFLKIFTFCSYFYYLDFKLNQIFPTFIFTPEQRKSCQKRNASDSFKVIILNLNVLRLRNLMIADFCSNLKHKSLHNRSLTCDIRRKSRRNNLHHGVNPLRVILHRHSYKYSREYLTW